MTTVSKQCRRCNVVKALDEFYIRPGHEKTSEVPGQYHSECKTCMKQRNKGKIPLLNSQESRVFTENLLITTIKRQLGWICHPGKAIPEASDVDVVVRGGVWLEVKHARMEFRGGTQEFTFTTTPRQQKRNKFLADIVVLICEWRQDDYTFHLFRADEDVFFMFHDDPERRRMKSGWTYRPGRTRALKHGNNRVVMTQAMMDQARDGWELIQIVEAEHEERMRNNPDMRDPHEGFERRINTSGIRW